MNEPSEHDLQKFAQVAVQAALSGGQVLRRYFHSGMEIRSKDAPDGGTHNLVSDADLESEQVIGDLLRGEFPQHELLGEEKLSGKVHHQHAWVIDPLDGTNNFVHGIPHFAVSIAYCWQGRPMVGIVYNPITDLRYVAVRRCGAQLNGVALHVSPATKLSEVLVGCGFYYDRGAMMRATLKSIEQLFAEAQIHGIRRMGAAALDLCAVAAGQLGGFFEYYLSPWDFAAGMLIVEEAGGRVSQIDGQTLSLNPGGVLASNGVLHPELAAIVQNNQVTPRRKDSDESA